MAAGSSAVSLDWSQVVTSPLGGRSTVPHADFPARPSLVIEGISVNAVGGSGTGATVTDRAAILTDRAAALTNRAPSVTDRAVTLTDRAATLTVKLDQVVPELSYTSQPNDPVTMVNIYFYTNNTLH